MFEVFLSFNKLNNNDATIYYIDTHAWYNNDIFSKHPILNELNIIISKSKKNEIIIIIDFKVPNKNFQYDSFDDGTHYSFYIINDLINFNVWKYFYKSNGSVGQIYIYHISFNLDNFII